MRKTLKNTFLVGLSAVTLVAAAPVLVYAQTPAQEAQRVEQEHAQRSQGSVNQQQTTPNTKASEAKLKACEKRQKEFTSRIARFSDNSTKQVANFTKNADRAKTQFEQSGKTLSNYQSLLNEVAANKTLAETAIANSRSITINIDCSDTQASAAKAVLHQTQLAQNDAVKSYKKSVDKLISSLKSVQGTTSSTDAKKQ